MLALAMPLGQLSLGIFEIYFWEFSYPMSAPMTLRWLRERFAGQPLRTHIKRTKWPTLLNPSTYRGMITLGVITAKVMTGRRVERTPLSRFDL